MLSGMFTVSASENNITVSIDGKNVAFDVPPQLINNRTMVPLRAIFEALGATVEWNNDTQTVISSKGNTIISLTINNPTMYVNGTKVSLDSPACLINGRTLVPVRAISEAFGTSVNWNGSTQTVAITTANVGEGQIKAADSSNTSIKKYDYSTAYNKLKSWLISNNESPNKAANGIFYSYKNVDLAIIYLKDTSIGFNASTTLESGAKFKMNLILFEKYISPGVVSTFTTASGSENKVIGTYYSPEITITSSDFPQTNDVAINTFKKTYPLFDTLMKSKGIDLKISDFGINY